MARPILAVLASVLVLGIAAAVWFLAGQTSKDRAAGPAGTQGSAHAASPSGDVEAARSDDNKSAASVPDRVALDASGTASAKSPQAAPKAKGSFVTGTVQDSAGQPIAGAKVLAMGSDGDFPGAPPLDALNSWDWPGMKRLEATSDKQGRFELEGAKPGNLRLAVRAPRFSPHDDSVVIPAGERHDLGAIVLDSSPIVEGRVVDSRGRGVAGAQIARTHESGEGAILFFDGGSAPRVPLGTTRDDGSFLLDQVPAGAFKLAVSTEDHPDKTEAVEAGAPGNHVANVRIVLEDGFEISGTVTGAPGDQLDQLHVVAAPHRDGGLFAEEFVTPGGGTDARDSKIRADGSFQVRGLRDGKQYDLTLRRKRGDDFLPFAGRLSGKVVARSGDRGVEIPYQPESALTLSVVDAQTKAPIESYHLEAGIDFPIPIVEPGRKPDQHPEGKARVGNLRPRSGSDKAQLKISATGYKPFAMDDIALLEGRDVDLGSIELEPAPVVRVSVLDGASGRPVSGARVTLRQFEEDAPSGAHGMVAAFRSVEINASGGEESEESPEYEFDDGRSHSATTDANGVATISSFEGTRCELVVRHREHAPYRSEPFVCPIGKPDEREARLGEGGSVHVTLVRADGTAVAGGQVEHRAADEVANDFGFLSGGQRSVTDEKGQCTFEHLAVGTHRFRPEGYGGQNGTFGGGNFQVRVAGMPDGDEEGWVDAIVAEGAVAEIKLVAPVRVTLSGKVTEAGEALAGANVRLMSKREGDLGLPGMMMGGGGPQTKTDGRGLYELSDVRTGDYVLSVTHPSRQMPAEFPLTIGSADKDFDVDLDVAIIEGRVSGPDGKPIANVKVSVDKNDARGSTRRSVRMVIATEDGGEGGMSVLDGTPGMPDARTDDDGHYSLRGVSTGVELVVRAEAKGVQPAKSEALTLHPTEVKRNVDLQLKTAGKVEVSTFRAGEPVGMVVVTAFPEGTSPGSPDAKTGFVQKSGKTTLDGLAPGKWTVQARPMAVGGPGQQQPEPMVQTVEVKADQTTPVRFDLP